eukprot:6738620-Lingulodinium_polyedra.AAC.1
MANRRAASKTHVRLNGETDRRGPARPCTTCDGNCSKTARPPPLDAFAQRSTCHALARAVRRTCLAYAGR